MAEFVFVLKCLVVTIAIVVLCQIRVGQSTIEGHALAWLHRSAVSEALQDVAEGAVKVGKRGQRAAGSLMGYDEPREIASTENASTGYFKVKRSAAYQRQKQKDAKLSHDRSMTQPLSKDEGTEPHENSGSSENFESEPIKN